MFLCISIYFLCDRSIENDRAMSPVKFSADVLLQVSTYAHLLFLYISISIGSIYNDIYIYIYIYFYIF